MRESRLLLLQVRVASRARFSRSLFELLSPRWHLSQLVTHRDKVEGIGLVLRHHGQLSQIGAIFRLILYRACLGASLAIDEAIHYVRLLCGFLSRWLFQCGDPTNAYFKRWCTALCLEVIELCRALDRLETSLVKHQFIFTSIG